MILELYILFQLIVVGLFLVSFFTRNEIMWALTVLFSGFLMYAAQRIDYFVKDVGMQTVFYPYLGWLNIVFFGLALVFVIFDMFDKYGKAVSDGSRGGEKLE